jgi:hypothetical protein
VLAYGPVSEQAVMGGSQVEFADCRLTADPLDQILGIPEVNRRDLQWNLG